MGRPAHLQAGLHQRPVGHREVADKVQDGLPHRLQEEGATKFYELTGVPACLRRAAPLWLEVGPETCMLQELNTAWHSGGLEGEKQSLKNVDRQGHKKATGRVCVPTHRDAQRRCPLAQLAGIQTLSSGYVAPYQVPR